MGDPVETGERRTAPPKQRKSASNRPSGAEKALSVVGIANTQAEPASVPSVLLDLASEVAQAENVAGNQLPDRFAQCCPPERGLASVRPGDAQPQRHLSQRLAAQRQHSSAVGQSDDQP